MGGQDAGQFQNPIGKLPKRAQWAVFFVLFAVAFGGFQLVRHVMASKPGENRLAAEAAPQETAAGTNDFTLDAAPGTDMTEAIPLFETLVKHCPGLYRHKADLSRVFYEPRNTFRVTVKPRPSSKFLIESRAMNHTCHFSVTAEKAEVAKRPCARLCTGEPLPDADGETHAFVGGKMMPWDNLRRAISGTRSDMGDVSGADVSAGAARLAIWAIDNLRWQELQEIEPTKFGLAMKDSDAVRGKKLCVSGRVIEIAADPSVPGKKVFVGGMFSNAGDIYRFIAVRSTGEIMQDSRAKFCGIFVGQQHYENSIGGVAHAVQLVGMFDLPENRK
jgi:hypothetical protein